MKIKLVLLFIYISLSVNAQNDSNALILKLSTAKDEHVKAKLLNDISETYKNTNPKLMLQYAGKAYELSKKNGYQSELGNALHNLGNANVILGNYSLALDYFSKEEAVFQKAILAGPGTASKDFKNGLARAYGSIGYVFMEQSNYSKALLYNFKALKIFEQTNMLAKLSIVYNNIGVIYKSQNNPEKALVYYEKCLEIQKKLSDASIGITTNNIGLVHLNNQDFKKARHYFDLSQLYFDKYPNPYGLAKLYYNYGLYYRDINDAENAVKYTQKALGLFENIENKFGISDCYGNLGYIYFDVKKYDLALDATQKGLSLAKELKIFDKVQAFEKKLSEIYEAQGNTQKALHHYKLYSIAKDSVTNAETVKNTVRAEMNFDFEKKEALQKQEQNKRELLINEQSKATRLKVMFTAFFIILVIGIVFLIYNRVQLKKTLTLEKELAIYEQKALHLQMNPHFIFNCLGSISSFIVKNSTDAAIKYLSKFSKLMRLTLEYSKESLIPIDREIESLQNYLELEQLRFNNSFQFSINKGDDIEDDVALPTLLLQPFVENAIIHGINPKKNDAKITVDFYINDQSLYCIIQDNGIGIKKSKALKSSHVTMHKSMALDITNKRLEMLEASTTKKASVVIEEIADDQRVFGTKVTLILPLQYSTTI